MAAFKILTRDGNRTPSSPADPRKPGSAEPEDLLKPLEQPLIHSDHESPGPPTVALQLPDLAIAEVLPSGPPFRMGSLFYWTGVVLGALFAFALIWTPQKAPVRPTEEAPAWSPMGTGQSGNAVAARDHSNPGQSPAQSCEAGDATIYSNPCDPRNQPTQPPPCQQPPQSSSEQPAGTIGGPLINNGEAHECPAFQGTQQAPQGFINSVQAPPQTRTASTPGARWDGNSGHARPSEAAPLGITTPVPQ